MDFAYLTLQLTAAAPFVAVAALLIALFCFALLLSLRQRFIALTLGKGGSLEESISILTREMKEAEVFRGEMEKYLKLVELRLRGSMSGLGIVRFNPYAGEGSGGNQSFSLALLDESRNGVVLSSLYSRDRVGVYCKPIQNGTSAHEMSHEEKEAVAKAEESLKHRSPRAVT